MKNLLSKKVFFLKVSLTIALLAWVVNSVEITSKDGVDEFFKTILNADLKLLIYSFLIIPIVNLVSTIKWYYLVKAKNLVVGYWRLFGFYIIGKFFNLTLPSSIGGDLVRIHLLGKHSQRYADSAAVVFAERVTGLLTLIIYTSLSLIVVSKKFTSEWLFYVVSIAFIGLILLIWVLIDGRTLSKVKKTICHQIPYLNKVFIKIEKMSDSLHDLGKNKTAMITAFLNSLLFYFFAVINAWISLLVFNTDVTFETMVLAVPIIMFIMNIPVSIGNIGIMEFAYTFTLTKFGISPQDALSMALLMRLKFFADAGLGGILYVFMSPEIGKGSTQVSKMKELK